MVKLLSVVMVGLSVPMFLASLKFVGQVILFRTVEPGLGVVAGVCLVLIVLVGLVIKQLESAP